MHTSVSIENAKNKFSILNPDLDPGGIGADGGGYSAPLLRCVSYMLSVAPPPLLYALLW